jgi:hypothetical protein
MRSGAAQSAYHTKIPQSAQALSMDMRAATWDTLTVRGSSEAAWVAPSGAAPAVDVPKPPLACTSCIRESAFTAEKQNDWGIVVWDGKVGSMETGERGKCYCIRDVLIPASFCFLICIDSSSTIPAKILLVFDTLPSKTYTASSPNRHNHVEQQHQHKVFE